MLATWPLYAVSSAGCTGCEKFKWAGLQKSVWHICLKYLMLAQANSAQHTYDSIDDIESGGLRTSLHAFAKALLLVGTTSSC
jgi:hypothetical protein